MRLVRRSAFKARRFYGGAVQREEAGVLAALAEPPVGVGVADDLVRAEGELAVGKAALEVLQAVAGPNAAAQVEGDAELGGELDHRLDDVLERGVAEVSFGGAAEVVVKDPVRERRDAPRRGGSLGAATEQQPGALEAEDRAEVVGLEEVALRRLRAPHRLGVGGVEARPLLDRGLGPGQHLDPVAELAVAADLLAEARAQAPRSRRVVHLDGGALALPSPGRAPRPAARGRRRSPAPCRPVDLGRIGRARPRRARPRRDTRMARSRRRARRRRSRGPPAAGRSPRRRLRFAACG